MKKNIEIVKVTYEDVQNLQKDKQLGKQLEMSWGCLVENSSLLLFKQNGNICALISFSQDTTSKNTIFIDEFEVLKNYRKQGIGKQIINEFIQSRNSNIRLLAKNESVEEFWYKCGFQLEYESDDEIPMIYIQP